jgi:hypothetical protein
MAGVLEIVLKALVIVGVISGLQSSIAVAVADDDTLTAPLTDLQTLVFNDGLSEELSCEEGCTATIIRGIDSNDYLLCTCPDGDVSAMGPFQKAS